MAVQSAGLLILALVAAFASVFVGVRTLFASAHVSGLRDAGLVRRAAHVAFGRLVDCGPLARMRRSSQQQKRSTAMRAAMPEMLRLLCSALDAGSTVVKALDYAADNCDEPLAGELKRAVWDLESGQGFDEAMERLRVRAGEPEFAYLAVAMEIQHRSGGSLSEVLASASKSLQKVSELEASLETQTTQGRLSARIVALMPFIVLAVLSLFTPGYLGSFFSSPLGVCMLLLALLLEVTGVVWVRRTLTIDMSPGSLGQS